MMLRSFFRSLFAFAILLQCVIGPPKSVNRGAGIKGNNMSKLFFVDVCS